MAVVSVDLAYRKHEDIGVCVLSASGRTIEVEFVPFPGGGNAPDPQRVAGACIEICMEHDAQLLLVDGPQAWKHPDTGLAFARWCEQELRTPAKTGLPGSVKPGSYRPFVEFSIAVFDALTERGWPRLSEKQPPHGSRPLAIESFPTGAWRTLGLPALRAKAKATEAEVTAWLQLLREHFALTMNAAPTHDQLQALVSGLAGVSMERGDAGGYRVVGQPPVVYEGSWREGYIVTPTRGG